MENPSVQDCGSGIAKLHVRCSRSDVREVHDLLASRVRLQVATVHARWWFLDSMVTAIGPADVVEHARQDAVCWLDQLWCDMQW